MPVMSGDPAPAPLDAEGDLAARISGPQLRKMEISEFSDRLRTQTNKNDLPFQERAIEVYAEAAGTLDRWMRENSIDGDFTACDTVPRPGIPVQAGRGYTTGICALAHPYPV
jgi:hypothetical protein